MNTVNETIIRAVIEKAERVCPDSLLLIGVYGSVATGDEYEKSDLDLLILVRDEAGRRLATGFILEDRGVGYDIYCTDVESLRSDARCPHAHLSKLLDARILYVRDEAAYDELLALREEAKRYLASEERLERVAELMDKAKLAFASAHLSDEPGQVRLAAYGVTQYLADALMIFHGDYFRRGVKRTFEELGRIPYGKELSEGMLRVALCGDARELLELTKRMILGVEAHTQPSKVKAEASAALAGTYEEMYSNWRNKTEEAAVSGDAYASFANLCSLSLMLGEIGEDVEIGPFPVMDAYDPAALHENVKIFDGYLDQYEAVYRRAGLTVKRYADVDAFAADYLGPRETPHCVPRSAPRVVVLPYDPAWRSAFAAIKDELEQALGDLILGVEHVGSTSVEGLSAKPCIDIDVVIEDESRLPAVIEALGRVGYIHEGDLGIKGREAFAYTHKPHLYPHHLYVCPRQSPELHRHLTFRDYLRAHPEAAERYGVVKEEAARLYPDDIGQYCKHKAPCIEELYRCCGLLS